ncbi:MAG TPA: ABC transporter permease [bacterium]|nr:ABC transporter permease [bacterium]
MRTSGPGPAAAPVARSGSGRAWPALRLPWKAGLAFLLLAVLWQAAALFFPPYLVPGLLPIARAFLRIVTDPALLMQALITWARLVGATLISVAVGTVLGLVMGLYRGADDFIRPLVKFFMGVPALNWVIIVVIWFSSIEVRIGFVLVMICTPLSIFSVYDGVRTMDAKLADMVRAFQASESQLVRLLYLPYVTSFVFTALKVNIGVAVRAVIVAELVGAPSGIGKELDLAKNLFDMPLVMGWTLWMVLTLLVMQKGVEWLEGRLLHWRTEPARAER